MFTSNLPRKPRNETPGYFAVTPPEADAAGFVPVEDENAVRPAVEPYMRAQLDLWKKKARAAEKECTVDVAPESDWKRQCWSFRAAMLSGDIYLWSHCVEPVGKSSVEGTFLVAQLSEGLVITPRIVGEKVGLRPVTIIIAILGFGELFGFVGILLEVPVSAILKVVLRVVVLRYQKTPLYTGEATGP